jgi:hypothetical protein
MNDDTHDSNSDANSLQGDWYGATVFPTNLLEETQDTNECNH